MKAQYKTAISDARWIAYDIPGNVGWIVYLVCVFRGLREKKDAYSIAGRHLQIRRQDLRRLREKLQG